MTTTTALQETLASEHAALYLYGLLGGRTSSSAEPGLFAAISAGYRQHRARRDQLRAFIHAVAAEPTPAQVAYAVPSALGTPQELAAFALELEQACAESLAALVARSSGEVRRWAATELAWSATSQLDLGGRPLTWPGAPDLDES